MGVGTTVQMALSIICCCAITFRPLLTKTQLFSSLAAKILACGSRLLLVRKLEAFPPSSDRTSDHGINLETASGTRQPAASNVTITGYNNSTREDEYPLPGISSWH